MNVLRHTHTHTHESTTVQEGDQVSKGNQKRYQPIENKMDKTKHRTENETQAECQLRNGAKQAGEQTWWERKERKKIGKQS